MSQEHAKNTHESHSNQLASSQSPYLLQHGSNPVDWYPWGTAAFEKAANENKPVFLSIGYSTCHWCHVMAHESFEDLDVARLMNDTFVCIKVDREERPDIDSIYMAVCQMLTRRGGWPLTIIMTPDKKPFFAATYIPKESQFGRIGMMELIPRIKEAWEGDSGKLLESADQITAALQEVTAHAPGDSLGDAALDQAYTQLAGNFDEVFGGFGRAPKFPTPHNFLFLLRYWKRTGEDLALDMVERTLEVMRRGGVYDHLGFGFHRYSTDREWLLPHFEKMLYDQAMLSLAYVETYQATGKTEYLETAQEIFEYVLRDMTSPEGGFFSAEDADSEGEEGKFYVWTEAEIRKVLDEDEADLFIRVFNVKQDGNFSEEATGERTGSNILHRTSSMRELAAELKVPLDALRTGMQAARRKLFEHREARIHPQKDDKILTDWNGLMIAALAKGALAFQKPEYAEAATRAADFVLGKLRTASGRLLHRYRAGEAGIDAHADDYAFMVFGLLNLYEATFDVRHLQSAIELNREMVEHFWDTESGGFYFTAHDAEDLLIRRKEIEDGAIPSGNSVAMLNLLRLARITGDGNFEKMASEINLLFSSSIERYPSAYTQFLAALDFAVSESNEVVLAGTAGAKDVKEMMSALSRHYIPNMVLLFRPAGEENPAITEIAGYTAGQTGLDGKATVYVCTGFSCEQPTTDMNKMLELLGVR